MKERFLLDENVPSSIIEILKKRQFEARNVLEVFGPGSLSPSPNGSTVINRKWVMNLFWVTNRKL